MKAPEIASDLNVKIKSNALFGTKVDLVITGSIGAIESVRFIRALRRLGASVYPWITESAESFVTKTSLEWAAANPVRSQFQGLESHVALSDFCIVAPCSAAFASRLARGQTDTATAALVTSHLGLKHSVFVIPNMHSSLAESPAVEDNLGKLASIVSLVSPRADEGKWKFPDPLLLADEISHQYLLNLKKRRRVVVSLGGSRAPIDFVRSIGNHSTGKLGSYICEDLFRNGFWIDAVVGSCEIKPHSGISQTRVVHNQDFSDAIACKLKQKPTEDKTPGLFMAAALLDFVPTTSFNGKISSESDQEMNLSFKKTPKVLAELSKGLQPVIACKLLSRLNHNEDSAFSIAMAYIERYKLAAVFVNFVEDLGEDKRTGTLLRADGSSTYCDDPKQLAKELIDLFL